MRRRCIFANVFPQIVRPRQPAVADKLPLHRLLLGALFIVALCAFELFNFDTTRYALHSLFGREQLIGISWAAILAIAFCAIDFAGLMRLFLPDDGHRTAEAWYLMGAWLLGATLNAIMTWWALSLMLLQQPLGNEILTRQQLLQIVPVFVASLVWLTRLLFIGSLSVATPYIFGTAEEGQGEPRSVTRLPTTPPRRAASTTTRFQPTTADLPPFMQPNTPTKQPISRR